MASLPFPHPKKHSLCLEGCPIHPTRVDSCFKLTIRPTGCRFEDRIGWNRHESFLFLSIRHAGSRFARDLINIAHLGFEAWLKMLSIRHDSIESWRIVALAVDSSYRKSICARLTKYSSSALWGWAENVVDSTRFDQIVTNRGPCCRFVIPEVDLRQT